MWIDQLSRDSNEFCSSSYSHPRCFDEKLPSTLPQSPRRTTTRRKNTKRYVIDPQYLTIIKYISVINIYVNLHIKYFNTKHSSNIPLSCEHFILLLCFKYRCCLLRQNLKVNLVPVCAPQLYRKFYSIFYSLYSIEKIYFFSKLSNGSVQKKPRMNTQNRFWMFRRSENHRKFDCLW